MRTHRGIAAALLVFLLAAFAPAALTSPASAAGSSWRPTSHRAGARHPKLASSLRDDDQAGRPVQPALAQQEQSGALANSVTVVVEAADIVAASDAIDANGGRVTEAVPEAIQAEVPADRLGALSDDSRVKLVREPYLPIETTTSEGVAGIGAGTWQTDGWTGLGVKIAIVDGGFANYATKLGTELPPSVETDFSRCGGTTGSSPHGTAVSEIVHDVAPDATLRLVCVQTDIDFANALPTLAGAGVNIVSSSIGWTQTGRGDGSGGLSTPAGAVAALRRQNILFVGAAGNNGVGHFNTYAVGDPIPADQFADPGDSFGDFVDISSNDDISFILPPFGVGSITMRWDAWPTTYQDFDMYIGNNTCGTIGYSENIQQNTPPVEYATFQNCTNTPQIFVVIVNRWSGTATPRMDFFFGGQISSVENQSDGGIVEPGTSPAALAVGAACWQNNTIEFFSSRGPTIDERVKPDITGPDATSSSVYGNASGCSAGFLGTSASTPHVAGAAALLKEVNPGLDVAELQALLEKSTVDAGAGGRDNVYGAGILSLGAESATKAPTPRPLTSVTPLRMFDSRPGTVGAAESPARDTPLGSGETFALQIRGNGGVPTDATAVVLNVAVTQPTGTGYLTIYPSGLRPTTANVNFSPGQTVSASVTATIGSDGKIRIFNSIGTTHVVVDLTGWYGPTGTGGPATNMFTALSNPARAFDSRDGTPGYAEVPSRSTPLSNAGEVSLQLAGLGPVPADATAVVVNVTATAPTSTGYITGYPQGTTRPLAALLNFNPGQTVGNLAVLAVGTNGKVRFFNSSGATHLVIDVMGYFRSGSGAGYVALNPRRDLDTRVGNGPYNLPLFAGYTLGLEVGRYYGVPADAAAVLLNVTAVYPTSTGFITVYPAGQALPPSANINFTPGAIVPNAVVAGIGSGGYIAMYNSSGNTHAVSDLFGYFIDPANQSQPLVTPPI